MADRKPRKAGHGPAKAATARRGAKPAAKAAKTKASASAGAAPPSSPLVPVLAVEDAAQAIAWYKRAFDAREVDRRLAPDGKVVHAELSIGGGRVYLADVFAGSPTEHPTTLGGTTVRLHLHAEKVDRAWARAVSAGATVTVPLADQPWGERFGSLRDPFGHVWSFSWPVNVEPGQG